MRILLLALLVLFVGGAEGRNIRDYALRIETDRTVCGATKVGPSTIETATHCVRYRLESVNGAPVQVVSSHWVAPDRIRIEISGVQFKTWAPMGVAQVESRVRWWGQPLGLSFVYREGHVAWVSGDGRQIGVDGTICHGDSGSGLFNDAGEMVGVVSAMTNEEGCTFLLGVGR